MAWRAHLSVTESEGHQSRMEACADLKEKWRDAPPEPFGMKPFADLCADVEAQSRGSKKFNENGFWRRVVRSVREGYFDGERELYSVIDKEVRITSGHLQETLGWDDEAWPLLRALVRDSWATIKVLNEFAASQRYEVPPAWKEALAKPAATERRANKTPSAGKETKADRTRRLIAEMQKKFPRAPREQQGIYDDRISAELSREGHNDIGASSIRHYRTEDGKNGKNGKDQ